MPCLPRQFVDLSCPRPRPSPSAHGARRHRRRDRESPACSPATPPPPGRRTSFSSTTGPAAVNLQIGSDKTASSSSDADVLADGRRRALARTTCSSTASRSGRSTRPATATSASRRRSPLSERAAHADRERARAAAVDGRDAVQLHRRHGAAAVAVRARALRATATPASSATGSRGSATSTSPAHPSSLLSIQLYNGAPGVGGAKADVAGNWSATTTSLDRRDATRSRAAALDTAGNRSALSASVQVTIDATAPAAPAAPTLDPSSDYAAGRRQHDDAVEPAGRHGDGGRGRDLGHGLQRRAPGRDRDARRVGQSGATRCRT